MTVYGDAVYVYYRSSDMWQMHILTCPCGMCVYVCVLCSLAYTLCLLLPHTLNCLLLLSLVLSYLCRPRSIDQSDVDSVTSPHSPMGPEKEMLPGGGGHKEAPPLPHKGGPPQPPTVAQYESIIKHLQKANDTMAHEVMGDTVQTPLPMAQYRPHCL